MRILFVFVVVTMILVSCSTGKDWRTASRDSAGIAPGPNSNTFTAWVAKQVPALDLQLPLSAIGSGYRE